MARHKCLDCPAMLWGKFLRCWRCQPAHTKAWNKAYQARVNPPKGRKIIDPKIRARIESRLSDGESSRSVARIHGVAVTTVRRWRQEMGL